MKKIPRSSELLWLFGVLFVALGVSLCGKADLGVSMIAAPAFIVSEALASLSSFFSVGVTEYLIQGLLLILLCLVLRRFDPRFLYAFAVAVIYGYTLDLFLWIFSGLTLNAVWLRWVFLLLGDTITALGVACFFRTLWPLQVYELFVAEVAASFRLPIAKVKLGFDLSLLSLSLLLAFTLFGDVADFDWGTIGATCFHSIGLGTLVTTAINSPLIAFWGKFLDKTFDKAPRFPRLAAHFKRG